MQKLTKVGDDINESIYWDVLLWVQAASLFLSPTSGGSHPLTRLDAPANSATVCIYQQVPEILSIFYNTHTVLQTKSLQLCLLQLACVRHVADAQGRVLNGSSAFCWNSHLSDSNHLIFVVFIFIDYNIGPGHTIWIMSFENIIYLNICSGILTSSGIIHREVIANTSQVTGKENSSCYTYSCLCTVLSPQEVETG